MTSVTPAPTVGRVAFSTAGLPPAQRVERWERHNARALIGLRCRTLSGQVLDATEINVQLERLHLARVRGSSHVVERDEQMVRRRPSDAVALFFNLSGEAFFYHDDGVRVVRPGQLLVCDADRPFMRGFSQGLEELVLKVPRHVYAEATGTEEVGAPRLVDFASDASSHAHSLARQIGRAARADTSPGTLATADEETLLQLVAAVIGPARTSGLAAAHRVAAQTWIERHLSDPRLSAAQVAAAVGISTRHLSRVFAATGTSVPQYVATRRLEAAHRLLQDPAAAPLTVAEVGLRCGFASAAHFSHAFRSHFGVRASDVRRTAAS